MMFCRLGEEGQETFYTTYDEVCDSFDTMELRSDLLRGIYAYGTLHNTYVT